MKKVNVLTLANSFTDSLTRYFQDVVRSTGNELNFERANFGGCELRRHWSYIEAEMNNPDCRIYQGGRMKFCDILKSTEWDFVTIQQASHESWRPETYHPYADKIIEVIRTHAPKAEILIQQTWSYHNDHPQFLSGSDWGINQTEMYNRLTRNYTDLAKKYKLRVIPSGCAVQLARSEQEHPFKPYPPESIEKLLWPNLPDASGTFVGQYYWRKNEEGNMALRSDLIHLNPRGEYLQACVWYAFLFGNPTSDITFNPDNLDNRDCEFMRKTAQKAVDTFSQVV
ncbi:MAG: DUF4886 domain-containing protein [Victivallales bacterium]|nr:DUF4886 domain-containing protein [Victivallales bacterium]